MKHKITTSILRRLVIILGVIFAFIAFGACANDTDSSDRTIVGVYASDVTVVYDGVPHSITVTNALDTDTVVYSTDGVNYYATLPTFTFPCTCTVYFKINRSGYKEFASSATVTISPCILSDISADDIYVVYDGQPHTITINGLTDADYVLYSIDDGLTFSSIIPNFTEAGEYTVYYHVQREYGYYKSSCTVTISPVVYGRYFNKTHGVVELAPHTASINQDGRSGYIGDDPFAVADGILTYKDLTYALLSDSDYVYKLTAAGSSVYFCAEQSGKLSVSFEDAAAVIKLGEDNLISVDDYNYCESGVVIDYMDLCFEQTFEHSADITDVNVALSRRRTNPITFDCQYYVYDGNPYSFVFTESVKPLSAQTTFTDVGRHTISVVVLSDEFLPRVADCTLVILPNIEGIYTSAERVMQISDGRVFIDGIDNGELSILGDDWALNGMPITAAGDGIMYDGVTYTAAANTVIVIRLNGETHAVFDLPQNADQLILRYTGATIDFILDDEAVSSVTLTSKSFTISLNGTPLHALVPNGNNTFILGKSDLQSPVILVEVTTE